MQHALHTGTISRHACCGASFVARGTVARRMKINEFAIQINFFARASAIMKDRLNARHAAVEADRYVSMFWHRQAAPAYAGVWLRRAGNHRSP